MIRRLLVTAAAVALLIPAAAFAGTQQSPNNYLDFFHSPGDDGAGFFETWGGSGPDMGANASGEGLTTYFEFPGEGTHTLNLWAHPQSVGPQGFFDINSIIIRLTGGGTIDSFTGCSPAICTPGAGNNATTVNFSWGDGATQRFQPIRVGAVQFTVGAGQFGQFDLTSGEVFDGNFGTLIVNADAIASTRGAATPEPASLVLLGIALGGVAFVRRRSA